MKDLNPYLKQVNEFMTKFGHVIHSNQNVIDQDTNILRVNLIAEELDEYKGGLLNEDKLEVLDALCDLQYVLSGTILAHGFGDVFDDAFAEVQRSNMSKACQTLEDAKHTQTTYEHMGTACEYIEQPDGTYFVERLSDRKLLKSIQYSPANLKQFIK